MVPLHVSIQAKPGDVAAGPAVATPWGTLPTLAPSPEQLGRPLPVSFEEAETALNGLPRMFVEPDGSLVWVSDDPHDPWQLDGSLWDREGKMLSAEIKGLAPIGRWEEIFQALGWPETELMFQLVQEAVYLDEAALRAILNASPSR